MEHVQSYILIEHEKDNSSHISHMRTDYSFNHYFLSALCSRHSDASNIAQRERWLNLIPIIFNMVLI